MIKSIFILLSVLSDPAAPTSDPMPSLLRLAVVDDSGSMAGEKIGLVRQELLAMLRAEPPSPDRPFALLVFGGRAAPARVFTDLAAAEAAIGKLSGSSGGTDIAAALLQAVADLSRLAPGKNAIVLLLTDGQDSNEAAIRVAEEKLDGLFSARKKEGLSQTVYLKQWGAGGLDKLIKRLRETGSADVVDKDSTVAFPKTLRPVVKIVSVRRLDDQHTLEIGWSAAVESDEKLGESSDVRIRCSNSDVSGETEALAPFGAPPKQKTLTLPVPPDTDQGANIQLMFVATIDSASTSKAFRAPQIVKPSHIEIPVHLPPLHIRNIVSAHLEMTEPPRWIDPLTLRAVYPAKLRFTVKAADTTQNVDRSASFRILPAKGCTLLEGKQEFTLPGPGSYTLPLAFEGQLTNRASLLDKLRFSLGFTIRPVNTSPHLTFVPPQVDFREEDLPAPDPILTKLSLQPLASTPATWVRLPNEAVFEVQVRLQVQGPVPPNTTLRAEARAPVRRVDVYPMTLGSGQQTLRLRIVANLPPTPQKTTLHIALQPRGAELPSVVLKEAPLELRITGPDPIQLAHTDESGLPLSTIQTRILPGRQEIAITVRPVLVGNVDPRTANGLAARLSTSDRSIVLGDTPLSLNHVSVVVIPLKDWPEPAFFWDERRTIPLRLEPTRSMPAVQPSSLTVSAVSEAPFKRLALWLSIGVSVIVATAVLIRMVGKLRNSE